jgi:SH3 domain protein
VKKLFILIISCVSAMAIAERAYVTDDFKITVRSGESTDHRILGILATGQRMQILSRNATSGYAKIKADNGLEGYVLQRHLTNKPIARERLAALEKELTSLKGAPDEIRKKLVAVKDQYTALEKQHVELNNTHQELEAKFTALQRTSSNAIRIEGERNSLRKQVADLTRHREELKQEKRELSNLTQQRWFMIGAGATLSGVLIGLLLPRLHIGRRKGFS